MKSRDVPVYWYGGARVPGMMRAVANVFGGVVALRRKAYANGWLKATRVSAPVIVVGNLTAGGTGKSPTVMAIVNRLKQAGYRPGVASRGYGRQDENKPLRVTSTTTVQESGDEPAMIAAATGVPVQLDSNRVRAAQALIQDGCDVIVCDDGLQHYALARDIEIEVIDANRRYGNALLMPAGPLREPPERGDKVDFRILNWAAAEPSQKVRGLWPMQYRYGEAINVATGRLRALDTFLHQRVHAVAGIGDPERFFEYLRSQGLLIIPHRFPDHHAYVESDFRFEKQLPVLMTSKDAIKCRAFAQPHFFELPIEPQLPEAFWTALLDRVASLRPVVENDVSAEADVSENTDVDAEVVDDIDPDVGPESVVDDGVPDVR